MENARPSRFRFRLSTLLFVVTILALLLVVVVQQVQIGRMRQWIAARENERNQMRQQIDRFVISQNKLTEIIRVLRDRLDRQMSPPGGVSTLTK